MAFGDVYNLPIHVAHVCAHIAAQLLQPSVLQIRAVLQLCQQQQRSAALPQLTSYNGYGLKYYQQQTCRKLPVHGKLHCAYNISSKHVAQW